MWTWKQLDENSAYILPHRNFSGKEEIKEELPENLEPIDFAKLYLTDEIIDLIVVETNRYAQQYIADHMPLPPHSPVNDWKPTTPDEIRCFLGFCILMGIIYKPHLNMYWSSDDLYQTRIFGETMTPDRCLLLLRFLHFANNNDLNPKDPDRDHLGKIRPLINLVRAHCSVVYSPGKDLCGDESLLLFKGRLAFKQFIHTKRARFGIKLYQLYTSHGILLDFLVYYGRMSQELVQVQNLTMS